MIDFKLVQLYTDINLSKGVFYMNDEAFYPIIGSECSLPFYVHGTGWCNYQYHVVRPEGYPVAQINYCTKGHGKLIVHNKTYIITEGMSFFLPAHLKHEYYTTDEYWSIHWITFAGNCLDSLLQSLKLTDAIVLTHHKLSKVDQLWNQIFSSIKKDAQYGTYRASGYLYEYLLEYHHDLLTSIEKTCFTDEKFNSIIDYIHLNYMEDIRLNDLAAINDVSPQYLCKQFKRYFNMRPFEYVTKRRLQVAKNLLMSGDYTVNEVAELIGYHDCSYFCKLFRKYESMSPSMLIPKS